MERHILRQYLKLESRIPNRISFDSIWHIDDIDADRARLEYCSDEDGLHAELFKK